MSRNGSGTYTLPAGNPVVTGTTISSTWANSTLTNIASALTDSLAADGQTTATGNLKMGNNRITGLANGIAATDAASLTQVTSAVAITGGTIGGVTFAAGSVSAPAIAPTGDTNTGIFFPAADTIAFTEGGAEAMRITSAAAVIVNGTSTSSDDATYQSGGVFVSRRASSAGTTHANFFNGGSEVGSITSNTTTTFYNITSDYRLKENATPITTGLQTIAALNPVNFDWVSNRIADTGFLAHEFQSVIPNSVMGTKDAVDANGNPVYQQIDRSGAIPFLVAAIKELKATVDAQATRIAALEA